MSELEKTNVSNQDETTKKEKKPLTKTEKILNTIGIVLLCIMGPILILDITYLIKSVANPNEVPSVFGTIPLVNMSESMELNKGNIDNYQNAARIELKDDEFIWLNQEEIKKNDLIFVKESNINDYLKGKKAEDIDEVNDKLVGKTIAFKHTEKNGGWAVIIHRIARVERASTYETDSESGWVIRTYGIHNESVDQWTTDPALIVGEYHGSRIAGVGSFVNFLQHWYGILIFAGIPIAIVIVYDIIVSKRQIQLEANSKTAELEAELQKLKAEKAAREAAEKEKEDSEN